MVTLLFIMLLIFIGTGFAYFFGILFLNIFGLPGALIGMNAENSVLRYKIGVLVSSTGQIYGFYSFMIYLISWTENLIQKDKISGVTWVFCFLVIIGVIRKLEKDAIDEHNEVLPGYKNPQISGLTITKNFSFFSFFVFVFYPDSIKFLWNWVINIGYPI